MLLGVDNAAKVRNFQDPSKNLQKHLRTFNNHLPGETVLLKVSPPRSEHSERGGGVSRVYVHARALPVRTL